MQQKTRLLSMIRRRAKIPCYHFYLSDSHKSDLTKCKSTLSRYNRRTCCSLAEFLIFSYPLFGTPLRSHLLLPYPYPSQPSDFSVMISDNILSSSLRFSFFRLSYHTAYVKKLPVLIFESLICFSSVWTFIYRKKEENKKNSECKYKIFSDFYWR